MNKYLTILLFCPSFLFAQNNPELKRVIDKIIRYDTEISRKKVPGFIIGVIEEDSTYYYPYGYFAKKSKQSIDEHTIFEIGSASKVYTASLISILIDKKILSIDEKVNDCLPKAYHNPNADTLTIYHLLTHTSKLPLYPMGFGLKQKTIRNPYANYTKEDLLELYKNYDFDYQEPMSLKTRRKRNKRKKKKDNIDTPYLYSHINYALLEVIVEHKLQKPFEQILNEELLQTLELTDTVLTLDETQNNRIAKGYSVGGMEVEPWTYQSFAASVGIKTSTKELLHFIKVHLGLEHHDFEQLFKQNFQAQFPTSLNKRIQVGYAWHIITNRQDFNIIGHPGATDGHRAEIHFVPNTKTAVVVLSNSEYHMDNLGLMVLGVINQNWKKKPKELVKNEVD